MGDQNGVERDGEARDDERRGGHDDESATTENERGSAGEWDEDADPDEWIVSDEGVDPETVRDGADAESAGGYTCSVCGDTFDSAVELHKHLYRVGLVE